MNQQTLEYIYEKYETKEFFSNYHKQKVRPDGRQFHQYRGIKFTIEKNKVALCQGQNIIMSQYHKKYQMVPYPGYSESIDKLKIRVKFVTLNERNQNKREKYFEEYIISHMQNSQIFSYENYVQNQRTKQYYLQTGEINIKIIGEDGCLKEALLLCLSMLFWVTELPENRSQQAINISNGDSKNQFLNLSQFIFPIKYAETFGQIVIDPTAKQQNNCTFQITTLHNLLDKNLSEPWIIYSFHSSRSNQQQNQSAEEQKAVIKAIQRLSKEHLQKIGLDLRLIRNKLAKGQEVLNVEISDN